MIQQLKKYKIVTILLILLNCLSWSQVTANHIHPSNTINFLDIGQGDATLVQTENSQQILIDGGPDTSILEKLNSKMPIADKTIELIILTHPHSDHLTGLIHIIENYQVEHIIYTGVKYNNQTYQYFLDLINSNNITTTITNPPQTIKITPDITINILYPNPSQTNNPDLNDTSIALELISTKYSALLMGDLSSQIEQDLIIKYDDQIDVDILKVGHHGSKTSTSAIFLECTTPSIAVISCGQDNQFGHPHPETLEILEQQKIDIRRTDIDGDITFQI